MRSTIAAFLAGSVFGIGLLVSQMANPAKVLSFLDLFGAFDPSLAFVMGGAIIVALPGYALLRKRSRPLFFDRFSWPERQNVDSRLILGAAIFGIGWGLVGFCPGPAVVALGFGGGNAMLFVVAMIAGMVTYHLTISGPAAVAQEG